MGKFYCVLRQIRTESLLDERIWRGMERFYYVLQWICDSILLDEKLWTCGASFLIETLWKGEGMLCLLLAVQCNKKAEIYFIAFCYGFVSSRSSMRGYGKVN